MTEVGTGLIDSLAFALDGFVERQFNRPGAAVANVAPTRFMKVAKPSPIYGMPILNVDQAHQIYVIKRGQGLGRLRPAGNHEGRPWQRGLTLRPMTVEQ